MQRDRFPSLTPSLAVVQRSSLIVLTAAVLTTLAWPCHAETVTASAEDLTFFESQVRPLLVNHCSDCHSAEAGDPEAGLSFDSRADFFAAEGVAVAGKPEESLLVKVVRYDSDQQMPPDGKLPDKAIATIEEWVRRGLPWPDDGKAARVTTFDIAARKADHWCWQQPERCDPPAVSAADWCRSDIDRFVLARLEAAGLEPAPLAPREVLMRRASEILTGLPADPADVARITADPDPLAFERYVDELLASPHYGERFARHWLDVAGYADSNGQVEADSLRPHAWRYRDYVVDSLNADKPWDLFLTEQLAGDELAGVVDGETQEAVLDPTRRELLVATGFLRTAPDGTGDRPADAILARNEVVAEQLKVVSSSLLGLTVGCAQCHDHRFDPITQADYYRLRAIFEPVFDTETWRNPAQRLCSLATPEDRAAAAEIEKQAAEIDADAKTMEKTFLDEIFEKEIVKLPEEDREPYREARATPKGEQTPEQQALIKKYPSALALYSLDLYDKEASNKVKARRAEATELRKTKPTEQFLRVALEVRDRLPETPLLHRGDPAQPKDVIAPGELSILAGPAVLPFEPAAVDGGSSGRRLAYARWLTSGDHPLLARVLVNRFWMHHFGEGLVASEGDFGLAGELPSHPALLDWLARRFMADGWRLKPLHRLLVTSTAYRQQARNRDAEKRDPDNRLLARWQVRRLDAESIRDAMLAVSNMLSSEQGGPALSVGRDDLGRIVIGQEQYNVNGDIVGIEGGEAKESRRSLYVLRRRSTPLTSLATFDAPTMLPNCEQRISSTVAPQSLFMLNDTFVLETSQAITTRLREEHAGDLRAQLTRVWLLLTSHEPTADDLNEGLGFVAEQAESLRQKHAAEAKPTADDAAPPDPQAEAVASYCQVLLSSSRFLYVE